MAEVSLADVNAAIVALITTPKVDYKIGDKMYKSSQEMDQLLKVRKMLMGNPEADITIVAFDALRIDEFGIDTGQEVL